MDEVLSRMIRKIIKEELSNVITEVGDLKIEVEKLQISLQKQSDIIQNQLKMISLNNQNKVEKENNSTIELLTSNNQNGMTEKKLEMKIYADLPDYPFWNQVLKNIEKRISKPSFDTWLKGTNAKQLDADKMIVFSQNDFQASWVEQRYKSLIIDVLKEVSDLTFEIEFRS
jgi:hypothetical protein